MKKAKKMEKTLPSISAPLSARELMGKQSVRATFRLPDKVSKLLKTAADHLAIKQKSLIDQLVADRSTLASIAEKTRSYQAADELRPQKTFVLSREALDLLNEISERHQISRDLLVEASINRLIPFVASEKEKNEQRKLLLADLLNYVEEGKSLVKKADGLLGNDDRMRLRLAKLIDYTEKKVADMKNLVENSPS